MQDIYIKTLEDLEDILPESCVEDIAQHGANNEAVYTWLIELGFKISRIDALKILEEWGFEDPQLDKLIDLKAKMLWLAAWNVAETARV